MISNEHGAPLTAQENPTYSSPVILFLGVSPSIGEEHFHLIWI